jgi:hypothetical protein
MTVREGFNSSKALPVLDQNSDWSDWCHVTGVEDYHFGNDAYHRYEGVRVEVVVVEQFNLHAG